MKCNQQESCPVVQGAWLQGLFGPSHFILERLHSHYEIYLYHDILGLKLRIWFHNWPVMILPKQGMRE